MTPPTDITEVLVSWCEGDQASLRESLPLIENKLGVRAHYYISRENPGNLLQTTVLVNEESGKRLVGG
jgi:hypothetical protein